MLEPRGWQPTCPRPSRWLRGPVTYWPTTTLSSGTRLFRYKLTNFKDSEATIYFDKDKSCLLVVYLWTWIIFYSCGLLNEEKIAFCIRTFNWFPTYFWFSYRNLIWCEIYYRTTIFILHFHRVFFNVYSPFCTTQWSAVPLKLETMVWSFVAYDFYDPVRDRTPSLSFVSQHSDMLRTDFNFSQVKLIVCFNCRFKLLKQYNVIFLFSVKAKPLFKVFVVMEKVFELQTKEDRLTHCYINVSILKGRRIRRVHAVKEATNTLLDLAWHWLDICHRACLTTTTTTGSTSSSE